MTIPRDYKWVWVLRASCAHVAMYEIGHYTSLKEACKEMAKLARDNGGYHDTFELNRELTIARVFK